MTLEQPVHRWWNEVNSSLPKKLSLTTLFMSAMELPSSPSNDPMWGISVWVKLRLKNFPRGIQIFFLCPVYHLSHNSSVRHKFSFVMGVAERLKRQIKQLAVDSAKGEPGAMDRTMGSHRAGEQQAGVSTEGRCEHQQSGRAGRDRQQPLQRHTSTSRQAHDSPLLSVELGTLLACFSTVRRCT